MTGTEEDVSAANQMKDYIEARGNPWIILSWCQEILEEGISDYLVKSAQIGEEKYIDIKVKRVQNRSPKLFATIQNVKI